MSVIDAVNEYIQRMLNSTEVSGMKALLLDQETMGIVGMVYSHTAILEKQVFLVERVDRKTKQDMNHLKAIIFVRPTRDNIRLLCALLQQPTYSEFHIFFSSILDRELLRELAEADKFELVRQVQEYYADYFAIQPDFFSLNLPFTSRLFDAHWNEREQTMFERSVDGITSILLSFKWKPVIRHQGKSVIAKRISDGVFRKIRDTGDLFEFGSRSRSGTDEAPLLLVLDRREDPITPLLLQWTYQSMVHELMTINNNRVDMRHVKGVRKDMKEIVLSPVQDSFFKQSFLLNFGDLGMSVKQMVEDYQRKTKTERKIDSIEDMQRVVENYSEYLAESSLVSKHVALVTELSRLAETRHLMEVSAIEQSLACENNHSDALQSVLDLVKKDAIAFEDKLRVVMMYALRYEEQRTEIASMCALLRDRAFNPEQRERVNLVRELLRFAGSDKRSMDLYSNKDMFAKASRFISTGLRGVENIYTQHVPLLARTVDHLRKSRLRSQEFPYCGSGAPKHSVREVVIFIVGGATYEEAAFIARLNAQSSEHRFVLGGTHVHNSKSFLDDLAKSSSNDNELSIQLQ